MLTTYYTILPTYYTTPL